MDTDIAHSLNFLEIEYSELLLFSEITIIFFAFFFNIFKDIRFDNVSIVFPDFEITIKSTLSKLYFFLKLEILLYSMLLKKKKFFFILSS